MNQHERQKKENKNEKSHAPEIKKLTQWKKIEQKKAMNEENGIVKAVKKEERKVFNKFEHGYLFDFKEPKSAKKMINGVEYLPPVPFRKR